MVESKDAAPTASETSASSAAPATGARPSAARRAVGFVGWATGAGIAVGVVVAAGAGLLTVVEQRAAAAQSAEVRDPIPVAVFVAERSDGFTVIERYAGRLEPARETWVAFESSGLVEEVMVEEGDRVAQGAIVARLDAESLRAERDAIVADRNRLQAELELALLTTQRQEDLSERGFSSQQRFDEARFQAEALRAQIDRADAERRRIDIALEKSTVTAPFDAVVAERALDDGAVAGAGARVALLQEVSRPQARIGLPPEVAASLEPGRAYPVSRGANAWTGRLLTVGRDLDPRTRTVTALFAVEPGAGDPPLPPMGELLRLSAERRIAIEGFWLPISALQEGQKGLWSVQTVLGEPGAEVISREAVAVEHVAGERVYVSGSLSDGARVVGDGVNRAAVGQAVRPVPSDALLLSQRN